MPLLMPLRVSAFIQNGRHNGVVYLVIPGLGLQAPRAFITLLPTHCFGLSKNTTCMMHVCHASYNGRREAFHPQVPIQ